VIALLVGAAWAGTPVVFDGGDPGETLAAVAARTGLPVEQLTAAPLRELLEAPTLALGASLRHCAGTPSSNSEVRSELLRAEASLRDGDAAAARDHLDLTLSRVGCLAELVEGADVGRVFLLRASLALEEDADRVAEELRGALAFAPAITWPEATSGEGLPPAGAAALEAARGAAAEVSLVVAPAGVGSGPWIDGREVEGDRVSLPAGLHLVQEAGTGGISSSWLAAEGDATLVLPGAYRRPVLGGVGDPATRARVEALLRATLPDAQAVYVSDGGGLWMVAAEGETIELAPATPVEVPETSRRRRRRRN
jgi:hypothetical protein